MGASNGREGSSLSSRSPRQHPPCACALPGSGHGTLHGSILLQQKWRGGWQDPGLQVLVHRILPSPTSHSHGMLLQLTHHPSSVSPAVVSVNAPAPAQAASLGFSSSSAAAMEASGDKGRSLPCSAPLPAG